MTPIDDRAFADYLIETLRSSRVRRIVENAKAPKRFLTALVNLEATLRQETRGRKVICPVVEILYSRGARRVSGQIIEGAKRAKLSKDAKAQAKNRSDISNPHRERSCARKRYQLPKATA